MKLAVGFFDGVHLGHRRILGGADAALTFRNHPSTVLSPGSVPPLIMSLSERLETIASALRPGSDPKVLALDFTEETKGLTPLDFIDFIKREYPDLEVIRCGPNWRFGAKGVGNAEFARRCGLAVEEVPFVMHNGEAVSSTRIRKALGEGDVADAAAMLGRPWRLSGEVFAGKGVGKKIGFPTFNVRPYQGSVPLRRGVYAVKTELGPGVANWGQAPTMGDEAWKECVLEVHLLGKDCPFDPPKVLAVEFLRFIRPERRFSSIAELTRQIEMDVRGCLED